MALPARALIAAALLAACAPAGEDVEVRHVASTRPYGDNGRLHLFVFDPDDPRPLDRRIALARRAAARDPDCRWIDAPREVIAAETARQGDRYADRLLVAPLRCRDA